MVLLLGLGADTGVLFQKHRLDLKDQQASWMFKPAYLTATFSEVNSQPVASRDATDGVCCH